MPSRWKPNVTVAAIIDRTVDGRHEFLLVEEETSEGLRLNNPAGHLDPGETPQHGAEREAFEVYCHANASWLADGYANFGYPGIAWRPGVPPGLRGWPITGGRGGPASS